MSYHYYHERDSFENALRLLKKQRQTNSFNTGSKELDNLIGGLRPGCFYIFYSSEGDRLSDRLLLRILVEALKKGSQRSIKVLYLVCGNYRRSRTLLDSEFLLSLIEGEGLDMDYILSNLYVLWAFSERQQIRAPNLIEDFENAEDIKLIAIQQLTKLFYGNKTLRIENPLKFTGMISRLKRLCCEKRIVLVATCRSSSYGNPIPHIEGGSYLRHTANVIIYLRKLKREESIASYLVKHPDKARIGRIAKFVCEEGSIWGEL